jgi:hypothetical protein
MIPNKLMARHTTAVIRIWWDGFMRASFKIAELKTMWVGWMPAIKGTKKRRDDAPVCTQVSAFLAARRSSFHQDPWLSVPLSRMVWPDQDDDFLPARM